LGYIELSETEIHLSILVRLWSR